MCVRACVHVRACVSVCVCVCARDIPANCYFGTTYNIR